MGGCGSVYKVELQPGQVVAVKKLHSIQDNKIANAKAFENEIHALLEIKHRNVVKLYGFCSHPRHSFLVYEFLERGSLKEFCAIKKRLLMNGSKGQILSKEWLMLYPIYITIAHLP